MRLNIRLKDFKLLIRKADTFDKLLEISESTELTEYEMLNQYNQIIQSFKENEERRKITNLYEHELR